MTYLRSDSAIVALARGPKGDTGEVSQAELDAAIAALKGDAAAGFDTLGEIEDQVLLRAPLAGPTTHTSDHLFPTQAAGNDSQKVATTAFVQQEITNNNVDYLALAGGTMTGPLVLAGDPSVALGAATKQYADARETAAKTYADTLVVGLLDDRGNYDASGNVFPSTGGSGSAGAVKKGDIWIVSVAGTLGGTAVEIGDQVRALIDTPGQTAANWAISEANIGYVPENSANKDTDGTLAADSDTKYASQKAAKTYSDTKVPKAVSGLTAAAAATDADLLVTDQGAGARKQTLGAVKTWIKIWIVKGDVGLANVDNTSDATKNSASVTLTNKTIDLGSNTLTGTKAQFNAALSDADFATLTGSEALSNKDLTSGTNTFPTFNQNTTGSAAKWTTARTVDGQPLDGTANITVIAPGTNAAASKATPVDADEIPLVDSAASNTLKKLTWTNLKATLVAYFRGQLPGTATNDTANSGNVGELVSGSGSGVSLTSSTTVNITSISLTAGDWDIQGQVTFRATTTTTNVVLLLASVSNVSGTADSSAGRQGILDFGAGFAVNDLHDNSVNTMVSRFSLSVTTTIYLVATQIFTTGTMTGSGFIRARRAR